MAIVPAKANLAGIGVETIKLFHQVKNVDTESTNKEWPKALFAAEADRFELWAVNLGLFVPGHGSLDYRVREAESLTSTLRRFMNSLNESLMEVLEYCDTDDQSTSQDHESGTDSPLDEFQQSLEDEFGDDAASDQESDIDLLLDSIRDPINRLYKLSATIRNPLSRFGSVKAQRYQQVDEETKVDLMDVFNNFDYDYVRSLFLEYRKSKALGECEPRCSSKSVAADEPLADDNQVWEPIRTILSQQKIDIEKENESFLIGRLSSANVRRRQQFAYWKKHREKLNRHASVFTKPPEISKEINLGQIQVEQGSRKSDPRIAPTNSITTASRLNIPQPTAIYDQSIVSVSEYAPSAWQPGKEIIGFPDPPRKQPGERFFECPFCFTLCSTDILAPKAWKAHLIHDLRPYICTYEHCKNPGQQYDSRQDWISHEDSSHRRVWRCPDHSAQHFLQLEDYQEHLRTKHESSDGGISNDPMIKAGESILTSPDRCCPICSLSVETARALQSHVALHLERFSVFSLPRSIDASNDAGEDDSNKVNIAFEGSRDDDFELQSEIDDDNDALPSSLSHKPLENVNKGDPYSFTARHRWKMLLETVRYRIQFDRRPRSNSETLRFGLMKWLGLLYYRDDQDAMYDTALKCLSEGQLAEAESLFLQMKDARMIVFGPESLPTLKTMKGLSSVYIALERFKEAEDLCRLLVKTMKEILGPEDPKTLQSMADLAQVLYSQGRYAEAETLYRNVLTSREKTFGEEHHSRLMCMKYLALLTYVQEKHVEAEAIYRETFRLSGKVLGEEHPDTLTSMGNLAIVIGARGNLSEAELLFQQVLKLWEKSFGQKHPYAVDNMSTLALILRDQQRYAEAERIWLSTFDLRRHILGKENLETLASMEGLAIILDKQGKYSEAERWLRELLELHRRVMGEENPETLTNIENLVKILDKQGKYNEAKSMFREFLVRRNNVLGKDHPDIVRSMDELDMDDELELLQNRWRRHTDENDSITKDHGLASSSMTITCNHCHRPISDNYYHCGVCDYGDFDLCTDCTGKGLTCSDESHLLIKYTIEKGEFAKSSSPSQLTSAQPPVDSSNLPGLASSQGLHEEITRVCTQFKEVTFDDVNLDRRTMLISMNRPWGSSGNSVFIQVELDFPDQYPELPPTFALQKTSNISKELDEKIVHELHQLVDGFAARKQRCLEAILYYLLREINLVESATIWFTDSEEHPGQGSQHKAEDEKEKEVRRWILHYLAVGKAEEDDIWDFINSRTGFSKNEFKAALDQTAEFDPSSQTWNLRSKAFKEFDPWEFEYVSQENRQQAIDNAIKAFDKMRLHPSEPQWQKLLPESERGRGRLSKLTINQTEEKEETDTKAIERWQMIEEAEEEAEAKTIKGWQAEEAEKMEKITKYHQNLLAKQSDRQDTRELTDWNRKGPLPDLPGREGSERRNVSDRFRSGGMTETQINAVLEKQQGKTRMARRHISIETLLEHQIDFEVDADPEYVIIKRWVPEYEQDFLRNHTQQIRRTRQQQDFSSAISKVSESLKINKALLKTARKGPGRELLEDEIAADENQLIFLKDAFRLGIAVDKPRHVNTKPDSSSSSSRTVSAVGMEGIRGVNSSDATERGQPPTTRGFDKLPGATRMMQRRERSPLSIPSSSKTTAIPAKTERLQQVQAEAVLPRRKEDPRTTIPLSTTLPTDPRATSEKELTTAISKLTIDIHDNKLSSVYAQGPAKDELEKQIASDEEKLSVWRSALSLIRYKDYFSEAQKSEKGAVDAQNEVQNPEADLAKAERIQRGGSPSVNKDKKRLPDNPPYEQTAQEGPSGELLGDEIVADENQLSSLKEATAETSSGSKGTEAMAYGVVMYDFKAEGPDELEAQAGETIIITGRSNPEWFVAKPIDRLGKPGIIPVSFVKISDMSSGPEDWRRI